MYILGNKFNSKAQQIDKNTEDIAELQEIVKTPAIIYNASVEISTDAGTVNASDVIQTIESIDNAFILDTVGSLFRIVEVVENTIYIMYVSSIRGQTGATGETGTNGTDGVSVTDVKVLFDSVVNGQNVYRVYVYLSNDNVIDAGTIALNEPNVEWQQATSNSDYVDGSARLRYLVNGNICTVIMTPYKQKNVAVAKNTQLYTGIPKPVTISGGLRFCVVSQDESNAKPTIRLNIDADGNILFDEATSLTNTGTYYGSVTYVINTEE